MLHGDYLEISCEGQVGSASASPGHRWRPAKRCKRQDVFFSDEYPSVHRVGVLQRYRTAHTSVLNVDAWSVPQRAYSTRCGNSMVVLFVLVPEWLAFVGHSPGRTDGVRISPSPWSSRQEYSACIAPR